MERITLTSSAQLGELERQIRGALWGSRQGDQDVPGLYYTIAHGARSWEHYHELKGAIAAYEAVSAWMQQIAKSYGGGDEQVIVTRPGLNS